MKAFLTSVILGGLLLGSPADVYALCGTPQPRLVCAEAAHSQGVVIARVLSHRVRTDNPDADLNVYRLSTLKVLRGRWLRSFPFMSRTIVAGLTLVGKSAEIIFFF